MSTVAWIIFYVWLVGFVLTLLGHLMFLPMITPDLAFVRALVWPVYWVTGWPRGTPLPMG